MRKLPEGTVTFLFTDVEGSTELLRELGDEAYAAALAEHRRVLRQAFAAHGGVEVDTQGDAFFVAFPTATGALAAAAAAQAALAIPVRMGIHTGTPHVAGEGYVGIDVNRAARIAAAGYGGQVLISATARELVSGADLRDLGEHRLKDLSAPERVFQLGHDMHPPLDTLYQTNLPVPATSFLGRERELAEVGALLEEDSTRLLTLTGPGGSGKTRLALQAAGALASGYPQGVWWVPLAAETDASSVLDSAGRAIGARNGIAQAIADRRLLLLLDNLEHLIDAAHDLARLLAACPNLDVLVTSRERLHIAGEHVYPVPVLARAEACALFTDRARMVRPDFEPGHAVDRLCERLDDLPLALELAAARTIVLTPEQLLDRLGSRLDLLRGGRDANRRQQTLRATIEWSYELLDRPERRLFARLAAFSGGCTLPAAEEICGAELDALQSLVEKSLVRVRHGERFWMLETIREFATERLSEGGEADTRMRHLDFYVRFADELEPHLDDATALAALADEEANLRAALAFSQLRAPETMLRLAGALWRFWNFRGQLDEGCRWLEEALRTTEEAPPDLRARALRGLGSLQGARGERELGKRLLEEALALCRAEGDEDGVARCLNNLGHVALADHDLDRAAAFYQEALLAQRRLVDRGSILSVAVPLSNLALIALARGDLTEARRLLDETVTTAKMQHGDVSLADAETKLAWLAVAEGRYDEVAPLLRNPLRVARDIGAQWPADAILLAALVASARGDGQDAAHILGALVAQRARLGIPDWSEENWWAPFDPYADLERELREGGYDAQLAEGEAMPFEAALELAQRLVD